MNLFVLLILTCVAVCFATTPIRTTGKPAAVAAGQDSTAVFKAYQTCSESKRDQLDQKCSAKVESVRNAWKKCADKSGVKIPCRKQQLIDNKTPNEATCPQVRVEMKLTEDFYKKARADCIEKCVLKELGLMANNKFDKVKALDFLSKIEGYKTFATELNAFYNNCHAPIERDIEKKTSSYDACGTNERIYDCLKRTFDKQKYLCGVDNCKKF